MRLWHYKLIPFLPKSQLIAQWRELNLIFKKQPKHILINYVYEYDKLDLLIYTTLIVKEMKSRNYKIKNYKNCEEYFKDQKPNIFWVNALENKIFENHHNNHYLIQWFYNLQEKYDRGQKEFSKIRYMALKNFVRKILEKDGYMVGDLL